MLYYYTIYIHKKIITLSKPAVKYSNILCPAVHYLFLIKPFAVYFTLGILYLNIPDRHSCLEFFMKNSPGTYVKLFDIIITDMEPALK